MNLDRLDRTILDHLQADARIPNSALAQKVGLSQSACLRRVRRLEEEGVIEGYAALLNLARLGRATTVFVEVTLTTVREEALEEFERAVQASLGILECHLMSGGADYLLRLAVTDTQEFERIHRREIASLPHVSRLRSSFALRAVSKRAVLPR